MVEQYLPLYRKYRPQQFSDLIGQENFVKAMTNAINTGKIAHAYLFCGPRGTGKTSSARILAKSLNCKEGPTLTPCGTCAGCQDILNGNMLDVIEMDAASNRSVEDAQNIIDKIHYAPVNGKYKIFIIDEVHMISKTAFNALLKTLEEPPENVIFILATTEPQKVLETIISRCQRFDFRRITVDDIVKRLKYVAEQEKIKISEDALLVIAKNSQGGMRDALALLDQISVLDVENEITAQNVNDVLGKIDTPTMLKISQAIFDNSVDVAIQTINEIYSNGNEPLQIIENFIQFYRNLSIIKTCKNIDMIMNLTLLSEDSIKDMQKQVQNIEVSRIAKIVEKLTSYHKEIKFTNNRYLWLELCFIDVASMKENECQQIQVSTPVIKSEPKPVEQTPIKPVETVEVKQEIVKEEKTEVKPQPIVQPEAKQNVEQVEPQKIQQPSGDSWQTLLSAIASPPARSFFNTFAKPVELNDKKVVITFKDANFQNKAKESPKFDAFKNACLSFFNVTSIEVEMRVGSITEAPKKNTTTQPIQSKPITTQPKEVEKPTIEKIEPQTTTIEDKVEENTDTDDEPDLKSVPISATNEDNNYKLTDEVSMVKNLFDAKVFED